MRTCKQVAHELRILLFEVNTVTFTTGSIDRAMGDQARHVAALLIHIHEKTSSIFFGIRELITDDLARRADIEFPKAVLILQYLQTGEKADHPWGLPMDQDNSMYETQDIFCHRPWIVQDFIRYMLQELVTMTNTAFWRAAEDEEQEYTRENIQSLLSLGLRSYMIPDEERTLILQNACRLGHNSPACDQLSERLKCCYPAAVHAVTFLTDIQSHVRFCLRRMILDEAYTSFGSLHYCAPGLLPFCRENPKLRIERRADIWSTVLTPQKHWNLVQNLAAHDEPPWTLDPGTLRTIGNFSRYEASPKFIPWIEETTALSSAGIPPACYSLVFYSDSVEATQSIVDVLAEDAAWQEAFVRAYAAEANKARPWTEQIHQKETCYFSEAFPCVMRSLDQGQALICFEGVAGMSAVVDACSEALQGRTSEYLCTQWKPAPTPLYLVPPSPLSSWLDILYEYGQNIE
jgi:hypothetical protein